MVSNVKTSSTSPICHCLLAFGHWRRTIGVLMHQQFASRFASSRLAALVALAEPILLVVLIILIRGVLRDRLPIYGTSIAVFFSSGFLPFYLFIQISMRVMATHTESSQRLPRSTSFDVIVATVLTETAVYLVMMTVWFAGMWAWGLSEAVPHSIATCLHALVYIGGFAVGIGLINSAIGRRFTLWRFIYARGSRVLVFASGVFQVVDFLPPSTRAWISWNPLAHGVEWFRLGIYGRYPDLILDQSYLGLCAGISLFVGIVAHNSAARTLK
jgi:capsular polysaccharide transport system permease protein